FARTQRRLTRTVGLALTAFDQFALLQSKATFTRVLAHLGLPQPTTRLVRSRAEMEAEAAFPYYVKQPYSTAGRGGWRAGKRGEGCGGGEMLGSVRPSSAGWKPGAPSTGRRTS